MGVEWDAAKARLILRRHGVRFADGITVLDDELALTSEDPHPYEDRYLTVGSDPLGRALTVCYTFRGENVRIISVRRATPRERCLYEGQA